MSIVQMYQFDPNPNPQLTDILPWSNESSSHLASQCSYGSLISNLLNPNIQISASQIISGVLAIAQGGTNATAGNFYSNVGAQDGIVFYDSTRLTSIVDFTYDPTQGIMAISANSLNPGISVAGVNSSAGNVAFLSASRASSTNGTAQYRLLTASTNEWTFGTFATSQNLMFTSHNGANAVLTMGYSDNSVTINSGNFNIANLTPNTVILSDSSNNLISFSSGTAGQILTSSGPGFPPIWEFPAISTTEAYGYVSVASTNVTMSFTDTVRYLIPLVLNTTPSVPPLINEGNNCAFYISANNHIGIQYLGAEPAVLQVEITGNFKYSSGNGNTNPNTYYISANLNEQHDDTGSFFLPINAIAQGGGGYNSGSDIPFTINPGQITTVPLIFQVPVNTGDVIYPAIRNGGPSNTPATNVSTFTVITYNAHILGESGASSSGVDSINGLTGTLDIISDGSVFISNPSPGNIQLSVGQYQAIGGTSQSLLPNMNYLCTNPLLTSLSLPPTCPQGAFIKIAGSGSGLFSITQNSGQTIYFGTDTPTTAGTSGHLDAQQAYSALTLICTNADTDFMAIGPQGNFKTF